MTMSEKTPAPVGAAVALDLAEIEARFADATADEVIYELWPALVAEVRRLTESREESERQFQAQVAAHTAAEVRAEAAEAEVVTLRAKVARSRSRYCGCGWCCSNNADGVVPGDAHLICSRYRAALATTGEGE